jgi:serine/threonine-protein kinase RsbW
MRIHWKAALEPLRFVIPSDFAEGRQVQDRIMGEVARHHYGPDATFAIKLALEEALINAIKHGNKLDKKKVVRVQANVTNEEAEILIEDEGPGFSRSSVPDPTADENLERLHGRGILLMEAYMNNVEWLRGGRCVKMVRRRDVPPPDAPQMHSGAPA